MSQGGEPPRTRHALPTSRAGLRVVLLGEKESRPTLALAFVLGHVFVCTATLPFARGSDGRCSNRTVVRSRVGRGGSDGRDANIYVTCVTETALYEQNGVPARSRPGSHDAPRPARARSPRVAEPTAQQRTLEA